MRKKVIDHLQLVERMREAQRKFFKTMDRIYLIESKQLEMQADLERPQLIEALNTYTHGEKRTVSPGV